MAHRAQTEEWKARNEMTDKVCVPMSPGMAELIGGDELWEKGSVFRGNLDARIDLIATHEPNGTRTICVRTRNNCYNGVGCIINLSEVKALRAALDQLIEEME